ncbi:alpha/beta hydrolase family protein [Hyphococcus lacteus]|uniref:Prolyl oligopeptidase family serine peptidase n=1 Tax=Hyphococcus lacteus TaxID=3143536 RepID=A0ABV3Z1I0_9PROT
MFHSLKKVSRIGLGLASIFFANTALAGSIPVDDLARVPLLDSVSLSADGNYLVALVAADGAVSESPAVSVWDLNDDQAKPRIAKPDSSVEFIGASALKMGQVLTVARKPYSGETYGCDGEGTRGLTHTYTYKLFFADRKLKKFKDPFDIRGTLKGRGEATIRCFEIAVRGSIRSDLLPLDPENVVVSEFDARTYRIKYKKYNLRTGKTELLFIDSEEESAGLIDPRDATVWTRSKVYFDNGEFQFETLVRDATTGNYDVHDKFTWDSSQRNEISVVGRDEETGKLYVITDQFSDKASVYMYDPATREYDKDPAFAHGRYEAMDVILGRSPNDFNQLLGFVYGGEVPRAYWLDPYFDSVQKTFEKILPDTNISIIDYSHDRSKVLVRSSASNVAPSYYLLTDGSQIKKLGDSAPWIDTSSVGKTSLIYYDARDGLSIPALLTLPAGWEKGDPAPPAIVMPHGGPWSRDFADWDPTGWIQFLTSRGYTVLQPQYRGSEGWGRQLWLAGDKEWGQKMQDDKDDGADWLVANGYAGADRMAIFGYSYGGFAAFAASVRKDGPFQCAIAGAGVADLTRLGRLWSDNNLQRYLQGRTVKGMNPMENADEIAMPILILHGDRDVRVPISHSQRFYGKVSDKTKAKLVEIEDMPHSLPWTPAQKKLMLESIDEFLRTDCQL